MTRLKLHAVMQHCTSRTMTALQLAETETKHLTECNQVQRAVIASSEQRVKHLEGQLAAAAAAESAATAAKAAGTAATNEPSAKRLRSTLYDAENSVVQAALR